MERFTIGQHITKEDFTNKNRMNMGHSNPPPPSSSSSTPPQSLDNAVYKPYSCSLASKDCEKETLINIKCNLMSLEPTVVLIPVDGIPYMISKNLLMDSSVYFKETIEELEHQIKYNYPDENEAKKIIDFLAIRVDLMSIDLRTLMIPITRCFLDTTTTECSEKSVKYNENQIKLFKRYKLKGYDN